MLRSLDFSTPGSTMANHISLNFPLTNKYKNIFETSAQTFLYKQIWYMCIIQMARIIFLNTMSGEGGREGEGRGYNSKIVNTQ